MPSKITIRSNDADARARVQTWVDEMELDPPVQLEIVLTVASEMPPPPPGDPVFEQPEISFHRAAHGGVTIHWLESPAVAQFPTGARRADVALSDAAAKDLSRCCVTFMSAVLIFLLRRAGWHHVHAATAIDPRGRGWLFAGNSEAGKSTTSALLASRGWSVGSDDAVFLARSEEGVVAVARKGCIALRGGGRELLGRLGGRFDVSRAKTLFAPEELGGTWAQRIRPDILVFLSVGDAETSMERIKPGRVLSQLVRWSAWVLLEPDLAQEHLDVLKSLGEQAVSYDGVVGRDIFDDPDRLMELVP